MGASGIEANDFTDKEEILNLTQIIARSARHLDDYMSKINDYSEDIKLELRPWSAYHL